MFFIFRLKISFILWMPNESKQPAGFFKGFLIQKRFDYALGYNQLVITDGSTNQPWIQVFLACFWGFFQIVFPFLGWLGYRWRCFFLLCYHVGDTSAETEVVVFPPCDKHRLVTWPPIIFQNPQICLRFSFLLYKWR